MESASRALRSRRAPEPPTPVPDELVRAPLLDAAAGRFDAAVTTVVAGAGFGKTTLLAQAVRANLASPRGVDAWVACQPGDEDPAELAAAIAAALGAEPVGGPPLDVALGAVVDAGPVDLCLVVDDLHELPAGCGAVGLLAELVRRRPPHLHLLLAGRRPPPLPLARLRGTGELVEIGEAALAFTDAEVDALAGSRPQAERAHRLAGWPSLVRLAVAAPATATNEFVWEEVVAALPGAQRLGLLALATLGGGEAGDVARVAGGPVDAADLAAHVPLVTVDEGGRLRAHDLWEGVIADAFPAGEVARVRRRAVDVLIERGEPARAGWCARRWGDAELLAAPARALVRATLGALPIDTAARWLAGLGDIDARSRPGPAADRRAPGRAGRATWASTPTSTRSSPATPRRATHPARRWRWGSAPWPPTSAAISAGSSASPPGCATSRARRRSRSWASSSAPSTPGWRRCRATSTGRWPPSPRCPARASTAGPPWWSAGSRWRCCCWRAGRTRRRTSPDDTLADASSAYVRLFPAVVRWIAGDASALQGLDLSADPDADTNERDRLYHAAYGTSVLASLGDRGGVERDVAHRDRLAGGHPGRPGQRARGGRRRHARGAGARRRRRGRGHRRAPGPPPAGGAGERAAPAAGAARRLRARRRRPPRLGRRDLGPTHERARADRPALLRDARPATRRPPCPRRPRW